MKSIRPPAPIKLANITVTYNRHPAVHHVSGAFEFGSMTGIIGPNGAGKSTLLQAILGLIQIEQGEIVRDLPKSEIAYLPQQNELDRSFPITVFDVVQMGHWHRVGLVKPITHSLRERAFDALAAVGLSGFESRSIQSLSVGQFQRVLFARVFLQDCKVIILDEPFNAIDAKTTADLITLLHKWHGQKKTLIAVSHDIDQVRQHFPETLLLARECLAWGPTEKVLTSEHLSKARQLAESWEDHSDLCPKN